MALIVSTGSNLGQREAHLSKAKEALLEHYNLLEESRIYESPAVDYTSQPDFLNQVLAFETPEIGPEEVIQNILSIEKYLGRVRNIDKGPRSVDIDILFWDNQIINTENLEVPHPRLFDRSFIVLPLKELKIYSSLTKTFNFPTDFDNEAWPLEVN